MWNISEKFKSQIIDFPMTDANEISMEIILCVPNIFIIIKCD